MLGLLERQQRAVDELAHLARSVTAAAGQQPSHARLTQHTHHLYEGTSLQRGDGAAGQVRPLLLLLHYHSRLLSSAEGVDGPSHAANALPYQSAHILRDQPMLPSVPHHAQAHRHLCLQLTVAPLSQVARANGELALRATRKHSHGTAVHGRLKG